MVLVLLLAAGAALAEIRIGTDSPETLVGTNASDHIAGKGGNDTLQGKAANDTYHFGSNFGQDTLTETAFVKVGKKKKPGGSDTLSFAGLPVPSSTIKVQLIPEWVSFDPSYNRASIDTTTDTVNLGTSPVEKVVGGPSSDQVYGGSARNSYHGGPGGNDLLFDWGGCSPALYPACESALPASNDTYLGFTGGPAGGDTVYDHGGTADRLDLRPLESSEVHFDAVDWSGDGEYDSLSIKIGSTHSVFVVGHFGPVPGESEDGRIEQIIFSDEVITSAASMM
jgi:Ca2+-binding RTX toxin-like protein